ncbi:DNA polymerase/3'-5' exonuclease PolX [Actinomadura luteofluorescens]|uniref:DNA polymerase/3'-5' exonuclease PolX n=1 Tax=Actinomadura luteofluorescens TaxID=46163 RepID=UPI002164288E|nr:DNA polymerase/3'-5' exonuclease PolX [Actinomadura glauciflava]MCR3743884.1 DNA polymerase (family 10) [Actinomadura glauciflava]
MRVNDEVGALLDEYADLLAITGGEAFKVRVYQKAARSVAGDPADLAGLDDAGLRGIPNVGRSIAAKIEEYLTTGSIHELEELRARIPVGVRQLTLIPTLGPKKAMVLYHERGIDSVEALARALDTGSLHGLAGFGAKTEENLRHGIEILHKAGRRVPLGTAMELAETIVADLSAVAGCESCAFAGSLRRMRDTVGDIDVLATSDRPAALMKAFVELPLVEQVIAAGDTKTSIRTGSGLQVDLRVVPPEDWGAALQYFTGSRAHNIRTREIAVHAGLKLSEYGLFDVETGAKIVSAAEDEVYARLGLPWIPPPLREDGGEIEAALRGELPDLVTEADVRGDLHTHTDLSDGLASLPDMVAAAAARGYSYYAVTDHAPGLAMQRMTDEKTLAQREQVRALDGRCGGMRVLHGTELNIDPDGGVDWPDGFLAGFDVCVASVHSHFDQPSELMTRRLVRACENPYVDVLGHPTARQIGRRPPVEADWDEVFAACARTGTVLEIDSSPDRLDLPAEHIRRARRHGVRFAVDTDAHAVPHLAHLRYGIGTAQRGWLAPGEVVNTWPADELIAFLRAHR